MRHLQFPRIVSSNRNTGSRSRFNQSDRIFPCYIRLCVLAFHPITKNAPVESRLARASERSRKYRSINGCTYAFATVVDTLPYSPISGRTSLDSATGTPGFQFCIASLAASSLSEFAQLCRKHTAIASTSCKCSESSAACTSSDFSRLIFVPSYLVSSSFRCDDGGEQAAPGAV